MDPPFATGGEGGAAECRPPKLTTYGGGGGSGHKSRLATTTAFAARYVLASTRAKLASTCRAGTWKQRAPAPSLGSFRSTPGAPLAPPPPRDEGGCGVPLPFMPRLDEPSWNFVAGPCHASLTLLLWPSGAPCFSLVYWTAFTPPPPPRCKPLSPRLVYCTFRFPLAEPPTQWI